jgi:hypothetical protein
MHRAHARGLRDIADGIAWRLFGYDRAALSHIADRETSRHIEAGGLEAELRAFGEPFNDRSGVALFNDLTHFLKLGDITVKRSDDTFELIEVKTGHSTSGRITRQRQHMSEVVQILNTGERDDEGSRLVISQMATIPESFIRPVATLISAASKRGAAVDQIGDSLIVECTDFLALNEGNEEAARATIESGSERLERWRRRGDFVMPCRSRERYVFVKNFAPFSIYPLPDLVRVKLATGAMWLDSYLNLTAVLKYFEDKGWRVLKNPGEHLEELENGQETGDALATIRKGPLTTTLPGALLGRIGMEFLRPKSIVALIEEMLAAGDQSVQGVFPTFREESRLWD